MINTSEIKNQIDKTQAELYIEKINTLFSLSDITAGIELYQSHHEIHRSIDTSTKTLYSNLKANGQTFAGAVEFSNRTEDFPLHAVCSCGSLKGCAHTVAFYLSYLSQSNGEILDEIIQHYTFNQTPPNIHEDIPSPFAPAPSSTPTESTPLPLPTSQKSQALVEWLSAIEKETSDAQPHAQILDNGKKFSPFIQLKFTRNINNFLHRAILHPVTARVLKSGSISSFGRINLKFINEGYSNASDFPKPVTHVLRKLTFYAMEKNRNTDLNDVEVKIDGAGGGELLKELFEHLPFVFVNRSNSRAETVSWGKKLPISLEWKLENSHYQLQGKVDHPDAFIFSLDTLYYFDPLTNSLGELESSVPHSVLKRFFDMPPISPAENHYINSVIEQHRLDIPQLPSYSEYYPILDKPKPILKIHLIDFSEQLFVVHRILQPIACVASIEFEQMGVKYKIDDTQDEFYLPIDGKLGRFLRDRDEERQSIKVLENVGLVNMLSEFQKLKAQYFLNVNGARFIEPNLLTSSRVFVERNTSSYGCTEDEAIAKQLPFWVNFVENTVKKLKAAGWKIEIAPNFPVQEAEQIDEWHVDIMEPTEGIEWFNLNLGIRVGEKNFDLVHIIRSLLKNHSHLLEKMAKEPDSETKLQIEETCIAFPNKRLIELANYLKDLFGFDPEKKSKTEIGRYDGKSLLELQELMDASKTRWKGGSELLALGHKLANSRGVQQVTPPQNFLAALRPYQSEGLNWLQFLRENSLGGVLADDMGLGKTIQALAHISLEKQENRLKHPVLIVAPTSVVSNWKREAEKFTPHLKVLLLHGPNRENDHEKIPSYDIVLTTYPLLVRDEKKLLKYKFHLLILDEAQVIKNAKSKSTLIVSRLDATHRLCMTGTPIENHLGELWSLFHFLMPGYLGDIKRFNQFFRHPIEKQGDSKRNELLGKRVAPFLLRRTKAEVVKELPPKTEILKTVELCDEQRDLYETIRVAMHDKIQQEVAKKGLARSQIVILDALLKLRQVCCDPRLVKLPSAKSITSSAKLNTLMELLTDLIEEGRKILLFSQFASMFTLIEEELLKRKISYVTITGSTTDRDTPVRRFQSGEVPLFLITLKAGGVGLNLTAADTVIHYDPWWNPAAEDQATDRAYRIGQDKPVFVYKLVTEGTVEEKILTMQERKRKLAQGIIGDNKGGNSLALSMEDLASLFSPIGE